MNCPIGLVPSSRCDVSDITSSSFPLDLKDKILVQPTCFLTQKRRFSQPTITCLPMRQLTDLRPDRHQVLYASTSKARTYLNKFDNVLESCIYRIRCALLFSFSHVRNTNPAF